MKWGVQTPSLIENQQHNTQVELVLYENIVALLMQKGTINFPFSEFKKIGIVKHLCIGSARYIYKDGEGS